MLHQPYVENLPPWRRRLNTVLTVVVMAVGAVLLTLFLAATLQDLLK